MRAPYEIADFSAIAGVPCPCGTARRAFTGVTDFPGTVHVTEISADAKLHYHKRLTETYFFLECGPDAQMQLNEERIPVQPGMCIMIRPGTRHRAIGRMKVLILVLPKFDPADEWFDDPGDASGHAPAATGPAAVSRTAGSSDAVRARPVPHDEPDDAESEPSHASALIHFFTTKAFLLAGLMLAVVLLLLAMWMPQLPRQRAISMVQAEGGSVYYDSNLPEWVYGVFGERVERFQTVYEINLDGTGVDDRIMPHLVNLREASTVWLNSAEITDAGLRHLLEFPRIVSLDLGGTEISEAALLPVLEQHRELDTVWLQETGIGDVTLEVLGGTPTLQNLTLSHTQLSGAGLHHLAKLPALSMLGLDFNQFGDEGLSGLAGSKSIVDLSLASSGVTDADMAALSAMPALSSVNLAGTSISDEGLRLLAASTSIASLNLDGTAVTDEGMTHLAAMPALYSLSLDGTMVSDAGLEPLFAAKHLTEIYVNRTEVTIEGIARLQKALPDCSVSYGDSDSMIF